MEKEYAVPVSEGKYLLFNSTLTLDAGSYDLVMTHALEWPSLTAQWLPDVTRYVRRRNRKETNKERRVR